MKEIGDSNLLRSCYLLPSKGNQIFLRPTHVIQPQELTKNSWYFTFLLIQNAIRLIYWALSIEMIANCYWQIQKHCQITFFFLMIWPRVIPRYIIINRITELHTIRRRMRRRIILSFEHGITQLVDLFYLFYFCDLLQVPRSKSLSISKRLLS